MPKSTGKEKKSSCCGQQCCGITSMILALIGAALAISTPFIVNAIVDNVSMMLTLNEIRCLKHRISFKVLHIIIFFYTFSIWSNCDWYQGLWCTSFGRNHLCRCTFDFTFSTSQTAKMLSNSTPSRSLKNWVLTLIRNNSNEKFPLCL